MGLKPMFMIHGLHKLGGHYMPITRKPPTVIEIRFR